jgi:hypothetical protein
MQNSSFHVLFVCPLFENVRVEFLNNVGATFTLDIFSSDDHDTMKAICNGGKRLFQAAADRCRSALPRSRPDGEL